MVDIHVSQAAVLAEIEAQIAEASQLALLAELANKHGYVSQLAHVNEVDPIMVRAGQLAHINEVDPIMVRVAALCVLVELEPTPRPVGRDDELSQATTGEAATGAAAAREGGTAAGEVATGAAATTSPTAPASASTGGATAQESAAAGGAASTATTQTAAAAAPGGDTAGGAATGGGAATTQTGAPAAGTAAASGGQTAPGGAANAPGGEAGAVEGSAGETGAATSASLPASSAPGSAATAGAPGGATETGAASNQARAATTTSTLASRGSAGATGTATGETPDSAAASSPTGAAGGVAAAIAAAGSQAATVSRAAAAAVQNELFAALAASRAAVAPGTVLSAGATGASGVSEVRSVVAAVYVDWDRNGIYTNESAYLVSARGNASLTAPEQMLAGGRGAVASCTVVLDNKTRRFSPANSAGALYAYIAGGAAYMLPVLVDVTLDGTTHTLFTGYIRELTESAPTPTQTGRVTLECRAKDEKLLQDKLSTPLADFLADSAAAHTEDYHIINLLETAGMVDGTDFVSAAYALANPGTLPTIDGGIFPIRYVWLDDESVLDEVWQLTAACCGWFYCDHLGKFHYHNLTAVLPDALERQYGAISTLALDEEQVAGLQLKWPTAELYNEVAVEVAPRAPGEAGEIWAPDDPIVVQPDQTKIVWCRLDAAQVIPPTLTFQGYTAGGIALNTNIVVEQTDYAQRVRLHIWNDNAQAAYLNILRLDGQTLTGGRTLEAEKVSAEAFWTGRPARRRSIRNNVYIQSEAQAETVAAYALKRQELPVLVATVPGVDNPALRLAYPVSIEYSNVVPTADTIIGIVSGLSWRLDNTGFRQDVTVLETASLFADYDPIFVLGTNKLGAAGADTAYLFY